MKILVILFFGLLLSFSAVGQQKGFVKGDLGERLDDLLIDFGKEGYSGAAFVAQNGEIILHKGYGWHVRKTPRNTTMVKRGGGRPDFESEVQWYRDENTVIIFTVNNDLNFRRRIAPAIEQAIWQKPIS